MVSDAGFGGVALLLVHASQFELRRNDHEIGAMRSYLEDPLEILRRFGKTSGSSHAAVAERAGVRQAV